MHKVNVIRLGIDNFVADHCSVYRRVNTRRTRAAAALRLMAGLAAVCAGWTPPAVAAQPGRSHAAADAAIVLARPLFAKDRRPPPEPRGLEAARSDRLPRLSGIVIAAAYRRAIFDGNGHPATYREGDRIGPYIILAIGSQRVTLTGPDGRQDIGLSFDSNRSAGSAAPVALSGPSILDRLNSRVPYRPAMPKLPTNEAFIARMTQPPPQ